jgi:hypothetical protein
MDLNADKKSTKIYLNISPVFFHIVHKLVQALLMKDQILKAVALEGDVLLPKPFLDVGPRKWSGENRRRGQKCPSGNINTFVNDIGDLQLTTPSKQKSRNGSGSRTSHSTTRTWKI